MYLKSKLCYKWRGLQETSASEIQLTIKIKPSSKHGIPEEQTDAKKKIQAKKYRIFTWVVKEQRLKCTVTRGQICTAVTRNAEQMEVHHKYSFEL